MLFTDNMIWAALFFIKGDADDQAGSLCGRDQLECTGVDSAIQTSARTVFQANSFETIEVCKERPPLGTRKHRCFLENNLPR